MTPAKLARLAVAATAGAALHLMVFAQAPEPPKGAGPILSELESFRQTGTILLVAAHPDDEDTQLIAYFARGRGYRTGYLSLTRGEGGQDLIGPELGDELGVMRTQELLAARRVDGGVQFFSRARDFGYSKDVLQTLKRWDRKGVLDDVVRVIRSFQPDVVITRFSPIPSTTHGHHTASAVMAVEAFKVANNPEVLPGVPGWQPKRGLWDTFRPGFRPGAPAAGAVGLQIGGFNSALGLSYGEIAALSRSNHRTQGFGQAGSRGARADYFQTLAGDQPAHDPFDGIDTSWRRYPGGDALAGLADRAVAEFDPRDPSKSVPVLAAMKRALGDLQAHTEHGETNAVMRDRSAQLDRILQACLGLYIESSVQTTDAAPGDEVAIRHTVIVRSPGSAAVRWAGTKEHLDQGDNAEGPVLASGPGAALQPNTNAFTDATVRLPTNAPLSQPFWLRQEGTPGMYAVSPPELIGAPDAPTGIHTEFDFVVGSGPDAVLLVLPSRATRISADPARGEVRIPLRIVAPVALRCPHPVAWFNPGTSQDVAVEITASRSKVAGQVRLVPGGRAPDSTWIVSPAEASFSFNRVGERRSFTFHVTAPTRIETAQLRAEVKVGATTYDNQRIEIRYEHIPLQLLQPAAQVRAASVSLQVEAKRIGYLPGAGDDVADTLAQMGCSVTTLSGDDLTAERLKSFDAVVIGIRAFNVRDDLPGHLDGLFAYVAAGGTVVAQYNTPNGLRTDRLGPYHLELERDLPAHRITDESSPITFLKPDHPALNRPNKIGPADFQGWVQERGLNFPSDWDQAHYTALLSSFDPGEEPQTSGLLVARYGKGHYVYTGLSFFRQLPAGVPGAARLFANLISLGATDPAQ